MAEQLYTIPVNEAFDEGSECPICSMYEKLEQSAVEFMMGPSYMEDDIRMKTDEIGFCKHHMRLLSTQPNRLGLALILKTHLDCQKKEALDIQKYGIKKGGFFKKAEVPPIVNWTKEKSHQCYLCDRIDVMFSRYLSTTVQLYKKDAEFREKYHHCKGFCQEHMGLLIEQGQQYLSGEQLTEFTKNTIQLYAENVQRVADDLSWFCDKFDYRYKDEPWKNSKDSIERAVIKTNGVLSEKK